MRRSVLIFAHDLLMAALAWLCAYWLRFNLEIPEEFAVAMWSSLAVVVPVQGGVFYVFGLYRGLWRFASVSDLKRILLACGIAGLAAPTALVMTQQLGMVPRSVYILSPLLLILFMGGVRFAYRAWKDGHFFLRRTGAGTPVLIVGADESVRRLIQELERSRIWRVVGIVEPGASRAGRDLDGVPILGGIDQIHELVQRSEVRSAIIAMPAASVAERRKATEAVASTGLAVMTVPSLDDLLTGRVDISAIRKVELEDLLGRDRVELDKLGLARQLQGKTILITGAGGSIGSELCRQIAAFSPRLMVFVELNEFALYSIGQEFSAINGKFVIADVKDQTRMRAVFEEFRPDIVFHAAAYKHVPLMEQANAWEAVRNNALGTLAVAHAAIATGVGEFVLISTDKAVNPTNVMGASKRLAEMLCQALQPTTTMRFAMVRFGNVLGSSGSVIPLFREQIARGGPVTVTHPEIIRYFMLIPEAAQLVLQAGLMAAREDAGGQVYVMDMGEPVKIADLARDMIRLSGFAEEEIRIEFTGLRPGEKLYEELLADGEATQATPHPKLRIAKPSCVPDSGWLTELESWLSSRIRDEAETKAGLRTWVPEYLPSEN